MNGPIRRVPFRDDPTVMDKIWSQPLIEPDVYYAELVKRNRGLISDADQQRLRRARILIAGCGSVGGAAVEPLIRLGAERLVLAEPGAYDIANLNRQRAGLDDVNRNKAVVLSQRATEINPFAQVSVDPHGVTEDNVRSLVMDADIILDGVDVTTTRPLRHKIALHVQAARAGVPVLSGYDVAGLQALILYDYRKPRVRPLHGKVRPEEADRIQPMEFLARVVPPSAIPLEIVPELYRQAAGESEGFPQLVYTADLFGVLAVHAVGEVLAGRPVRRTTIVDVAQVVRPNRARLRTSVARIVALIRLQRAIAKAKRGGHDQAAEPPPAARPTIPSPRDR